ncbi:MAG TPA: hypothetical protein VGM98_24540 [Schlesneria sp.]|jgi:hypothetical protein
MVEPEDIVISCDNPDRIMSAIDAVMPQLTVEVGRQLSLIKLVCWQRYGFTGLFERTNNRSVASILFEFASMDMPSPIESGELEGVKYELFDAPDVDGGLRNR